MRGMLRSERPRGATPVLPAAALFVAGALAACGSDAPSPPAPSPTAAALVADVDVEGDGRTIHIICQGPTSTGRPTVVFENGAGPNMSTWSRVVEQIIPTDRACTYDRAGVGSSTAPPGDRTTQDQVEDFDATLQGAGVTGPIVLVAHSRGAWNTILYSAEDAHQVVGIVLVDADPPGLDARWLEELPPETAGENPDITEARTIMSDHSSDPSVTQERLDLEASQALVEAAPGFGARTDRDPLGHEVGRHRMASELRRGPRRSAQRRVRRATGRHRGARREPERHPRRQRPQHPGGATRRGGPGDPPGPRGRVTAPGGVLLWRGRSVVSPSPRPHRRAARARVRGPVVPPVGRIAQR